MSLDLKIPEVVISDNGKCRPQDIENTGDACKLVGGENLILRRMLCFCGNSIFVISIVALTVWWIYAVSDILPKIQESERSNPGDWSTAFFIAISLPPTLVALALFTCSGSFLLCQKNQDKTDLQISRCFSIIGFITGSVIITVWYAIGSIFILEPLKNTHKANPNDWGLAFFVFISFSFTVLNLLLCCCGSWYITTADDGCLTCDN